MSLLTLLSPLATPVEPTGIGGGSEFSPRRRRIDAPVPVVSLVRDDAEALALVLLLL